MSYQHCTLLARRAIIQAWCRVVGHDWRRGLHDEGNGWCQRCGENDHQWVDLPPAGVCHCSTCQRRAS